MSRRAVIGIDVGTGSAKAVAITSGGRVLAHARAPYPTMTGARGEQDPIAWLSSCRRAVSRLLSAGTFTARDVEAVAFAGQIRTLVLSDGLGRPIGPAMLWYDPRWDSAGEEARRRLDRAPPNPVSSRTAGAKLLWVRRNEPERYASAAWFLSPKDFVKLRLSGVAASDPSDASGTGLLDVVSRNWSRPLLDALAIDVNRLPPIVESTAETGRLTSGGARLLGLREGTPVIQGGADNACAAVAAGFSDGGRGLISVGTCGIVLAPLRAPRPAPRAETFCHVSPDRWYALGFLVTGGRALDWAMQSLFSLSLARASGRAALREALELGPLDSRPVFLPYLEAESAAAGALTGLRAGHTRADVLRAIVDGIALALRALADDLVSSGIPLEEVVATGPLAREPGWLRVLAASLGLPVVKPDMEDTTELGAAVLAAVGSGLIGSLAEADAVFRLGAHVQPDESEVACYEALAERFARAGDALAPSGWSGMRDGVGTGSIRNRTSERSSGWQSRR